jgi:hypothetical protein
LAHIGSGRHRLEQGSDGFNGADQYLNTPIKFCDWFQVPEKAELERQTTNPSGLFQLSAVRHLIVDHSLLIGNERPYVSTDVFKKIMSQKHRPMPRLDFGRDLEKNRVQAYILPKPMDN